jgi:hypothetical protein
MAGGAAGWSALAIAKWVGALAVVGALGAGGVVGYRASTTPAAPLATVVASPAPTTPSIVAPVATNDLGATALAAQEPPASPLSSIDVASLPAAPRPRATTAIPTAVAIPTAATTPTAAHPLTATPTPTLPPTAAAAAAPSLPPRASVAEETRILREANAALQAGDAPRALALLDSHARTFPNGALGEERNAQRIFALCKLGRVAEARAEAVRFSRYSPDSPMAKNIAASCAGDSAPR